MELVTPGDDDGQKILYASDHLFPAQGNLRFWGYHH